MKKVKRSCMPLALGVVLILILVGAAGATPNNRALGKGRTMTLVVPAAAFDAEDDGYHYYNSGWMLRSEDAVQRYFTAYVPFPQDRGVTLDSVEVVGKDNTSSFQMCVEVLRFDPLAPGRDSMGKVCSGGPFASPTDPSVWNVPLTTAATISPDQALYLWLMLDGNVMMQLHLYGVKITYHRGV